MGDKTMAQPTINMKTTTQDFRVHLAAIDLCL